MKVFVVILFLTFVALFLQANAEKKIVCYWGTWAVYRQGKAKFTIDDIDPQICTHMIYTFLGANEDGTWKSLDPYLDLPDNYGKGYISKFIKLRKINPKLKLMASIGGWNMGTALFTRIASNPGLRSRFASSVLDLLQKFDFDGFDLDWEYPNDKVIFIEMLKELKNKLQPAGKIFTIAVGATAYRAHESYDIGNIIPQVDFINLMTYDLHGSWDHKTGINSPLYSNDQLSVNDCVKFWLSQGCPKEKLILGISLYGRSFTLANQNNHGIGQSAWNGRGGKFVPGEAGFLPYNEICTNVKFNGWTRVFDQSQKAPYSYKGDQWVGYDDLESINLKLDYIINNNLGGAMFWSIETDDFGNICGDGKNPLLNLANRRLRVVYENDDDKLSNNFKYDLIQNYDDTSIDEQVEAEMERTQEIFAENKPKISNLIQIIFEYHKD
ncbi:hypothetical protein PVAND_000136 [Polypedilum vanderplanki]|uniref:chitinase n=1 Tax=Polypedilum vanderplanki TaxID=319348 RepID=A0A9J6BJ50_POLVA|nr:hypothetical protein PVAND_000136 [Polypedilum vanderplanki]